uniref:Uncharacterized protein n=1 Tax=Arundo donax TaxID=35708 RepID=A0A0A9J4U7_ARUDO
MSARHLLPFLTALACRLPSSPCYSFGCIAIAIASSCSASKRWKSYPACVRSSRIGLPW